ncbi:MAG: DUF1697 domain-containing protein [Thermoanaerobaculia bacterium]
MKTYVGLLRGINVGGHRKVPMADLRALLTGLGLADVRSLLQSGNVVFRSGFRTPASLETLLETEAEKGLKLRTDFIVRTAAEWDQAVAHNPFPGAAEKDPSHLVVMFLKDAPGTKQVQALREAIKGPETVEAVGRELYMIYPDGVGDSKLTINVIERRLETRGTGRNWNTVMKLAAAVNALRALA